MIFYTSLYTDLYNRGLRTAVILFTHNVSSHKTDWILSELPLLALSYILYHIVRSLMNAFEGECLNVLCLTEISINVNKLLAVLLFPIYFPFFILRCGIACILLYPLFHTDFVAIFLFIHWLCKEAHYFNFWSFCWLFLERYFHFRNNIY